MRFKTLTIALTALIALGALSATGASAESWKLHGSKVTESLPVTAEGNIELTEHSWGYSISCPFKQKGTVQGATGTITGEKKFLCTPVIGNGVCESAIELEALNLPWTTELAAVGGFVRNSIKSSVGVPEWLSKCTGTRGKTEILCGIQTSTGMFNASEGVEAWFDSESPKGNCLPGGGYGLAFNGAETIRATSGLLGVETIEWLVNGKGGENKWVASRGKLKFTDPGMTGKPSLECPSAGEQTLEGGRSELTTLTLTGCKEVGAQGVCNSSSTVEALDLPWRSALATSEGATRGLIKEGGKGLPGFKIKCVNLLGTITDKCTGNTSAAMKIVTGGVDETFDSKSEKLTCEIGGANSGTIEGTNLLENPTKGPLTFKSF
jgi:hypothetical protein